VWNNQNSIIIKHTKILKKYNIFQKEQVFCYFWLYKFRLKNFLFFYLFVIFINQDFTQDIIQSIKGSIKIKVKILRDDLV